MVERRLIAFGQFEFESASGMLTRDGKRIAISHRGAGLLAALLRNSGAVCTKAELLDAAWPEQSIEESNLSVQIAALRRALGTDHEWIETVPRIGYRFTGATGSVDYKTVDSEAKNSLPLLAVVPFQWSKSPDDDDYFGNGVVDDIAIALSKFKSFAVIARGSSIKYRDVGFDPVKIAAELGIQYILKVGVHRSTYLLRMVAQLFDGVSGKQLWGEHYDGKMDSVFEFQDQITPAVASIIEPHIQKAELEASRRKSADSISIYDRFLQARALILSETETGNARAYDTLNKALIVEPENGLLLSHAAWALEHRHTMGWPAIGPDDVQRCRDLAHRGIAHADGDATVLAVCGMALLQTAKEYDLGIAAIQSAVDANPNHIAANISAGVAHLHCGDLMDSERYLKKSLFLSPRDPHAHIPLCTMAHVQLVLGKYDDAISWASRSLTMNPHFDPTYWMLIAANAHLGRIDEARSFAARLMEIKPWLNIAKIEAGQPAKNPSRFQPVAEGLQLAGFPR